MTKKMKASHFIIPIILLLVIIGFFVFKKSSPVPETPNVASSETITEVESAEVAPGNEKFAYLADKSISIGNLDADTVIINTQGGPLPNLAEDEFLDIFGGLDLEKNLILNVHQAHTYAPEKYKKSITFDFAKQTDIETTKILADTVSLFKKLGKKVYVVGISFGAFVVQNLLATQGPVADGYLIMVGRLDMPGAVWKEFAKGANVGFEYKKDGTFEIVPFSAEESGIGGEEASSEQNMSKLAAGLGYKRFTEELKATDLSKVIYAYGTIDQQVGGLTAEEIAFLESRKAKVIKGEGLDHGGTVDAFFLPYMKELLGITK